MSFSLKCRSCGSTKAALILDLGLQPLANNLLTPADRAKPEPKFPLRLAVCESCWLLQITDLVPPVELFSEYLYFSSFSDLMLRHAREACDSYLQEFGLNHRSLVVEWPAMTATCCKISSSQTSPASASNRPPTSPKSRAKKASRRWSNSSGKKSPRN
jgi:hypothetical protein